MSGRAEAGAVGEHRAFAAEFDAIDAHRPGNILQALLAAIDEVGRHLALHLPPGVLRKRDASRRSDAFDARRDVDAIAKNIVAFDDDVADIDADAELDRIGFRSAGIVLANVFLDLYRTGNRVDGAAELYQHAVAHELDDPARMGGDIRIDKVAPQRL